jgi:hypothetical protein
MIAGLMCTVAKIHTKGVNMATAAGGFGIAAWMLYTEFSGKGAAIGLAPTMGPIPCSGSMFWGVWWVMCGICFMVGGPAAGKSKKN